MCRYGLNTYKEPFACFDCRKSFKQINRSELPEDRRPAPGAARQVPCPQCGKSMADMGHDFKAPKQTAVAQWRKVQLLFDAGFSFHSCGCCGPGYRPEELAEVEAFIASQKTFSQGKKLIEPIMKRKAR